MTHIWVPRTQIVEIEPPPGTVGMHGRFKIIKRDRWGKALEQTPWFSNLILNAGLNRMGTGAAIAGAMIGTGTSTPVVSQTQLDAQATFTTTSAPGSGFTPVATSPYNNTRTFVYRTALGALNGNFSEVGVGWASNACFSRELIRDGGGNPTTISVLSTEQLDIFYQLAVYPPLVDTSGSITIAGVGSRNFTGRAASAGSGSVWDSFTLLVGPMAQSSTTTGGMLFTGTLGSITTTPSGVPFNSNSSSVATYSNNSNRREVTYTWATSEANATLQSVLAGFGNSGIAFARFQYQFDSPFTKTNLQTLAFNFAINWARRP